MENRGFTLVEMIVAVGLFAVVMVIAIGALLSLTAANRKAQALQSVMNNLNVAMDGMVRNIRMGTQYHCGVGGFSGNGSDDCSVDGGTEITFTCNPASAACAGGGARWSYAYDQTETTFCKQKGGLCECKSPATDPTACDSATASYWSPITSPDISIKSMSFFIVGTAPGTTGDYHQPKAIIEMQGSAGSGQESQTTQFHIQTTAVQRQLDI